MNLKSWINNTTGAASRAAATTGAPRRACCPAMLFSTRMIFSSVRMPYFLAALIVFFASGYVATAQTNFYTPNGTEYAVIGSLFSDQVFPDAAISTSGGFVVWQDKATDGDGWGISACRLDSTLSGTLGTFRVNASGAGDQENPRVARLKDGGAFFIWQGGLMGKQHIYARPLTSTNTFVSTNDILVNTPSTVAVYSTNSVATITTNWGTGHNGGQIIGYTTNFVMTVTTNMVEPTFQANPAIAVLNNSNVVVVWGSYNQAGAKSMQDVYGQILSPSGEKIGGEFLINQFTSYNQRTPAVVALAGGGFAVSWISEQERQLAASPSTNVVLVPGSVAGLVPSVDVYARLYNASGTALGGEFLVNNDINPCVSPAMAAASDGTFLVVWAARDLANSENSLDIHGRIISGSGTGGSVFYINTKTYGDQYLPRVSSIGLDYLVTWTSLGQDGSREGIYGQYVHNNGALIGNEFRVNTTTLGQQMQPTVASDGVSSFLVVWTSFSGYPNTFDLVAQRYLNVTEALPAMSAPYVWVPFVVSNNVYQPRLVVSWAPVQGMSVAKYEIYVDGAAGATGVVTSNQWTMSSVNGLTAGSTHSFQVDYVLTDGRRSPISPMASGATWQNSYNWGGIPFEWMAQYFGGDFSLWPSATSHPGGTSLSLYQIFLSGGDPTDSTTWLKTALTQTAQGMFLSWNTQPGAMYQVQVSSDFNSWTNLGSPRFAAGTTDSIYVGGSPIGYYRVMLLR